MPFSSDSYLHRVEIIFILNLNNVIKQRWEEQEDLEQRD